MSDVLQIRANEDNCVYIYNYETEKWQKLCDIEPKELPTSVITKINKAQKASVGREV